MNAKNCPRCGRLFSHPTKNVCPNCEKAEEDLFQDLKTYIEENPFTTMGELSEATHVPIKRITQYIREGRLEIAKGAPIEIGCEKCGQPIPTGRYCPMCALEIGKQINSVFNKDIKPEQKEHPSDNGSSSKRMFTLGRSKKL